MTRERESNDRTHEGDAVTVLVAAAILFASLLVLRVAAIGSAAAGRARAQTAADAAALAGVVGGRDDAETLANENGGVLTSWTDDGDEVQVSVRVDDAVAVARAERVSTPPFG